MADDPFDDFARAMNDRSRQQIVEDALQRAGSDSRFTEAQQQERALIAAMARFKLKRGQMLILGPRSVRQLSGIETYTGNLPDKYILDRSDWAVVG